MSPLAEALDHAHSQGILHRDIKPSNVLIDAASRPILADFGLARLLAQSARITHTEQTVGTPDYMSPEQALGGDVDHRSDLYSFGVIVYEMLVGKAPFHGETPASTLLAQVHQSPPSPTEINPDIEPGVEAIILRTLAKSPDDRYPSATHIVRSLARTDSRDRQAEAADDTLATAATPARGEGTAAHSGVSSLDARSTGTGRMILTFVTWLPRLSRRWWLITAAAGIGAVLALLISLLLVLRSDGEPVLTAEQPTGDIAIEKATRAMEALTSGKSKLAALLQSARLVETPQPESSPQLGSATISIENAMLALAALDGTSSQSQPTESVGATRSRVEQNVRELRGIGAEWEIETRDATREELASVSRTLFIRDYLRSNAYEAGELYKALELIGEDDQLADLLATVPLTPMPALFDDESDTLYILEGMLRVEAADELAYAGAYMSGIQKQGFDVSEMRGRARELGYDQFRAAVGFIGGDLFQVQQEYRSVVLSGAELPEVSGLVSQAQLPGTPSAVRKLALFAQREGGEFVAQLFGTTGSWELVNEAYSQPPVSTEQILHVEKYVSGEEPIRLEVPDFSAEIGEGWVQLRMDTMGEFLKKTHLEEHLDTIRASSAAAGWGGDAYSLLVGPQGERVLILLIAWDSLKDSSELFEAYQLFAKNKTQGAATATKLGDTVWKWVSQDEAIFLGQNGPSTLLVIGDNEPLVGRVLELLGGS